MALEVAPVNEGWDCKISDVIFLISIGKEFITSIIINPYFSTDDTAQNRCTVLIIIVLVSYLNIK